jgi:transcriptional regulator with XRE-family HTH domain
MPIKSEFANAIRHRRRELGLTLEQVHVRTGWSIPYVSELERGVKQPPPAESVGKLSAALEMDDRQLKRLAAESRRSIELDLEGASVQERQLAALLGRKFQRGLSEKELTTLLDSAERLGWMDEGGTDA